MALEPLLYSGRTANVYQVIFLWIKSPESVCFHTIVLNLANHKNLLESFWTTQVPGFSSDFLNQNLRGGTQAYEFLQSWPGDSFDFLIKS